MIYQFLILSDEADKFKREIKISPDATFLELHRAILDATGYKHDEMCSFFICDEDWSKKTEITLIDMDASSEGGASSEVDTYLMEDTALEELMEDEHQKLLYVFDYLMERSFFIELSKIITGQSIDCSVCSLKVGDPPPQSISIDEMEKRLDQHVDVGEDFYGDMEYNDDELDSISGDYESGATGSSSYYDDERY
ncbi:MAG: plasmid pRiA4b ORF-3 family protein [Tannerella sp.]|jgi:hypothetical protein|nr:plasmid pRiA4b ORF-3 family protein [Tannerella sp.]